MRLFGKAFFLLIGFLILAQGFAMAGPGTFSAKNLRGPAVLGEDGLPLPKALGRVELLWGTRVFASGGLIKDGFFALGTVSPEGPDFPFTFTPLITIRCWNSDVSESFDGAVRAGHGFGAVCMLVELAYGSMPPLDLTSLGFPGITLVAADPVPYWIRGEEFVSLPKPDQIGTDVGVWTNQIFGPSFIRSLRFETADAGEISVNLLGLGSLDPLIRLFDANGVELARSDSVTDPAATRWNPSSFFQRLTVPKAGTYHLAVSARGNGSYSLFKNEGVSPGPSFGRYDLSLARGIHGVVQSPLRLEDGFTITNRPVDLLRFRTVAASPAPPATWLLIPGWQGAPSQTAVLDFATNLARLRPDDAVLLLDWAQIAGSSGEDPFSPAAAIRPIAGWAAAALAQLGVRGTNLNIVGHSFGAYIADEIAQRIPGGVNALVALDPSANVAPVQFDPIKNGEINFRRDSRISWSIHASAFGSEATPTTAREAFLLDTGTNAPAVSSDLFTLLKDMMNGGYPWYYDPLRRSNLFVPDRLVDAMPGPFAPDRFSTFYPFDAVTPGYEGILQQRPWENGVWIEPAYSTVSLSVERSDEALYLVVPKGAWSGVVTYSTDLVNWKFSDSFPPFSGYPAQRFRIPDRIGSNVAFRLW